MTEALSSSRQPKRKASGTQTGSAKEKLSSLDRQLIELGDTDALRFRHGMFVYQLAMCIFDDPTLAWIATGEWWVYAIAPEIKAGRGPNGSANFQTWVRGRLVWYMNKRWRMLEKDEDLLDRRTITNLADLDENELVFDVD